MFLKPPLMLPVVVSRLDPPPPLAHVTPWPVVVDAYLAAAVDSDHTRRAYRRHLYTAFTTLGTVTVAEITGAALADYRARLTNSPLSPASHGQALAALRAFLSWSRSMGAHQLPAEVVATALRTPRSTPHAAVPSRGRRDPRTQEGPRRTHDRGRKGREVALQYRQQDMEGCSSYQSYSFQNRSLVASSPHVSILL